MRQQLLQQQRCRLWCLCSGGTLLLLLLLRCRALLQQVCPSSRQLSPLLLLLLLLHASQKQLVRPHSIKGDSTEQQQRLQQHLTGSMEAKERLLLRWQQQRGGLSSCMRIVYDCMQEVPIHPKQLQQHCIKEMPTETVSYIS